MTIKNAIYQVDNGSEFDEIHFKTNADQVFCKDGKTTEYHLSEIEKAKTILDKIKTVDGSGSGLDANYIEGVPLANLFRSGLTVPTNSAGKKDIFAIHGSGAVSITAPGDYIPGTLPADFKGYGVLNLFRIGSYAMYILTGLIDSDRNKVYFNMSDSSGYKKWTVLTGTSTFSILESRTLSLENENLDQSEILLENDFRLTNIELGL